MKIEKKKLNWREWYDDHDHYVQIETSKGRSIETMYGECADDVRDAVREQIMDHTSSYIADKYVVYYVPVVYNREYAASYIENIVKPISHRFGIWSMEFMQGNESIEYKKGECSTLINKGSWMDVEGERFFKIRIPLGCFEKRGLRLPVFILDMFRKMYTTGNYNSGVYSKSLDATIINDSLQSYRNNIGVNSTRAYLIDDLVLTVPITSHAPLISLGMVQILHGLSSYDYFPENYLPIDTSLTSVLSRDMDGEMQYISRLKNEMISRPSRSSGTVKKDIASIMSGSMNYREFLDKRVDECKSQLKTLI